MKFYFLAGLFLLFMVPMLAQGPPITADKPIMLGGNSITVKTLAEIRTTESGSFTYIPLMVHYLPTSNSLVAVHIPYLNYTIGNQDSDAGLADIKLMGKYQFYRKDATGKTFRMVAKTIQTLPTGKELDLMELSTGIYQGYYGLVTGYETLKYGISTELGYNLMPGGTLDELRAKLGFGLPLLPPRYPNRQLNLYFEYANSWLTERGGYQLLYAQGVQLALKSLTFDLAVQVPVVNDMPIDTKIKNSVFLGSRFTF